MNQSSTAFGLSPIYKQQIDRIIKNSPRNFEDKNKNFNKTRYVRADRMRQRNVAVKNSDESLQIAQATFYKKDPHSLRTTQQSGNFNYTLTEFSPRVTNKINPTAKSPVI